MKAIIFESHDFQRFILRLKSKDNRAWEKLRFLLKRLVTYWLVEKGMNNDEARWIYNDCLTVLFEHIEECEFENFKKLKSYFLAIVDRKVKEAKRKKRNPRFVDLENSPFIRCPIKVWNEEMAETIEQRLYIEYVLNHLKEVEKTILFKYFYEASRLKEIAQELGTSEENCRIIKFRALKKLKFLIEKLEK
jgi:RNA polymerase sigma factor (sigma-70 family)